MEKNQKVLYGELVARAWEDETFKNRFLNTPKEVLKEAGIAVDEGVEYKVIEAPKLVQYLVLPHEGREESLTELAKLVTSMADKEGPALPEGAELRIIQNTGSVRYLVLPAAPDDLSEVELKNVAGGESSPPPRIFMGSGVPLETVYVAPGSVILFISSII